VPGSFTASRFLHYAGCVGKVCPEQPSGLIQGVPNQSRELCVAASLRMSANQGTLSNTLLAEAVC
jgi:hypothetical protein